MQLVEELKGGDKGRCAEPILRKRILKRRSRSVKINRGQPTAISLDVLWGKGKGIGRRKTFDRAALLQLTPMLRDRFPVIVQLLLIAGAHDAKNRFPAHRHFFHDQTQCPPRAAVLRFHRTRVCHKREWDLRQDGDRD